MISALFSQLKLPFASGVRIVSSRDGHRPSAGRREQASQKDGFKHPDFVSSMAFAHSCYDPDADLATHAKTSDAALACELLREFEKSPLRSPRISKLVPR